MLDLLDENATQEINDLASPQAQPPTPAPPKQLKVVEPPAPQGDPPQVVEEVVIEEVSIDGMCGVY